MQAIPVLFLASIPVFLILHLAPGFTERAPVGGQGRSDVTTVEIVLTASSICAASTSSAADWRTRRSATETVTACGSRLSVVVSLAA